MTRRKRADPPAPPDRASRAAIVPDRLPPPGSSPAGKLDPSRSLVRMAVGGAVVVVLALVAVVATKPSDADRTATPRWVPTPSPGPSGRYLEVSGPGPVGRDERVAMGDATPTAEWNLQP